MLQRAPRQNNTAYTSYITNNLSINHFKMNGLHNQNTQKYYSAVLPTYCRSSTLFAASIIITNMRIRCCYRWQSLTVSFQCVIQFFTTTSSRWSIENVSPGLVLKTDQAASNKQALDLPALSLLFVLGVNIFYFHVAPQFS